MISETIFTCAPVTSTVNSNSNDVFACGSVTNITKYTEVSEETKTPDLPELDLSLSKNWIKDSLKKFGHIDHRRHPAYMGPTRDSNILIPGRLTVGGYPATEHVSFVPILQKYGVTHFVCLNTEKEYGNIKLGFPAYAAEAKLKEGEFIHFPIVDMSIIAVDAKLKSLCVHLKNLILSGNHVFVHCAGGHGRTGTVVAILLKMLYGKMTLDQIFDYIQYSHDQRIYYNYGLREFTSKIYIPNLAMCFAGGQVPTPQTSEQRIQVCRVVNTFYTGEDLNPHPAGVLCFKSLPIPLL